MAKMTLDYQELIEQMTLEEKASLLSGQNFWNTKPIPRLGIPSIMLTDGPHGLRKQGGKADHLGLNKSIPSTCFPTASALANSWDIELLEQVGSCLGEEAAAEHVSVLLGPGLNIKRNPLCGRNFEYFSEDPFLSGKLAAAMICGIQSQGVSACPKHFAVNSQETRRMVIDEVVDERALRELYLEGFRYAVCEGKPKMIMSAYNRVNGVYANENTHLLQDVLYGEWSFEGVVVTDWGGENDRVAGLIAGNQLEMPSSAGMTDREVVKAVRAGELDENLLDERIDQLLRLVYSVQPQEQQRKFSPEEHQAIARDAARRSTVLVKNEGKVLPICAGTRVAVIGDFAKSPRYQGAGSSLIEPTKLESALDALIETDLEIIGYEPGFRRFGGKSERKQKRACALVEQADVALVFLGLDEGREAEGVDREHMLLRENQTDLLREIKKHCARVVVVLASGAPVESDWMDDADAILLGYLGGQAGGGAIADLVTGKVAPSGKLAETYPERYSDVPTASIYPGREKTAEHRESIFVGYRYFDTVRKPVRWPFGFGLTYTTFKYDNINVHGNDVSCLVHNTGERAGEEIVQVYVSKRGSAVFRAEQELKGFARVRLEPGEMKLVSITLDSYAFSFYHAPSEQWLEEPGEYEIRIGASSRDIRLRETITRAGTYFEPPYQKQELPHYFYGDVACVPDGEFCKLLGYPLPSPNWDKAAPLGTLDTIGQGAYKKGFARFLYRFVKLVRGGFILLQKPVTANNIMFAMNLPYRALARLSDGAVDQPMLDGILIMVNGRFWKGLWQTLRALGQKRRTTKGK
ncbi:MAG TPA: glycoside hydrolase family 3 C-terminal domain-containing protein [Candidatus Cryosericum sp.]|nr:glycoside hydrolase family 3 C-terminal domain-containing protein [Candidatus Cryosericum sp.]